MLLNSTPITPRYNLIHSESKNKNESNISSINDETRDPPIQVQVQVEIELSARRYNKRTIWWNANACPHSTSILPYQNPAGPPSRSREMKAKLAVNQTKSWIASFRYFRWKLMHKSRIEQSFYRVYVEVISFKKEDYLQTFTLHEPFHAFGKSPWPF